ncbi:MAG TPA: hypothetical protein PLL01_08905 [Rhodoferax sp.]|nr:hypothetical protein [Rhodoferax sp.]
MNFTGVEAAALMLGFEPNMVNSAEQARISPTVERMNSSYLKACGYHNTCLAHWREEIVETLNSECLESTVMQELSSATSMFPSDAKSAFYSWLSNNKESGFVSQRFSRIELSRWLDAIGMKSVYKFTPEHKNQTAQEPYIDPSDLPNELHAANIAFRAVTHGYGDNNETFKNRLRDYLEKHFIDLTPEAVNRIATVANPDKTTGRKTRKK